MIANLKQQLIAAQKDGDVIRVVEICEMMQNCAVLAASKRKKPVPIEPIGKIGRIINGSRQ